MDTEEPKPDAKAVEILYKKMITYDTKCREILDHLMQLVNDSGKADYASKKTLYQEMRKLDEMVIDIAHKLAPYQSPKLESVEVKSQVVHRHVMRVPEMMQSAEEWMKATGASTLAAEETIKKEVKREIVESIHDFDDEDDSYNEPGMIH